MTTVYKVLGQSNPTANTMTTVYTVPAGNSAVVSSLVICNQASANANVDVAVCVANTTVTATQYITRTSNVIGYDTMILTLGITLAATDTIRVQSSNGNTSVAVFGSEIY